MTRSDGGLVLLRKPAGVTSFRALGELKRSLGTKKIGHTGTLDRFATGLLVVLVGRATKLAQFFSGLDKSYRAVFRFGVETETLDPEGAIVGEGPVPALDDVKARLGGFVGTIRQRPPRFSAVHVGGERAYRRALSGEDVVVPERDVVIYGIDILGFSPPDLSVSVSCSSGTYVRSLARDLAQATGSRAHVVELERHSVGPFSLEGAAPPDEITDTAVVPFEVFVPKIPTVGMAQISDAERHTMDRGGRIAPSSLEMSRPARTTDGPVAVFGRDGRFLGIVASSGDRIRYIFNRGSAS